MRRRRRARDPRPNDLRGGCCRPRCRVYNALCPVPIIRLYCCGNYLQLPHGRYYLFCCTPKSFAVWIRRSDRSANHPIRSARPLLSVTSPLLTRPLRCFDSTTTAMGPAPLNVPASPSPNKTPKIPGPSVNGTTKQPPAAKNIAPNDISSPHELTAFVRLFLLFEPG